MLLELKSAEAFQLLSNYSSSLLIDVRTPDEWHELGVPDLKTKLILLSIQKNSSNFIDFAHQLHNAIIKLNASYKDELKHDQKSSLYFICSSGIRSKMAAELMIQFGYDNCYNIVDGCRGNEMGNGWIANNLPWKKN